HVIRNRVTGYCKLFLSRPRSEGASRHCPGDDMSIGRQALEALHLPITMKTNSTVNTSQADGEQVVRAKKYQVIKLGVDWHAEHYRVVRMIDGAGPEPAQRFRPEDFLAWAQKQ